MESKTGLNATAEAQRKALDTFQGSLDAQWVNIRVSDGRMGRCLDVMQRQAEIEKDFQEADRQDQDNIVKLLREEDSHGKDAVDNMMDERSKTGLMDEHKFVEADHRKKVQDKMGSLDLQTRENEMERREEGRLYAVDLREQIAGNAMRRAADLAEDDALAQNVDDWDREWGVGDHEQREKTFQEHSSPGHVHGLKTDSLHSPSEAMGAEGARVEMEKREKGRVYSEELRQQIAGNTKKRAADLASDDALAPNVDDWDREWGSGEHDEREKIFQEHSSQHSSPQFSGHEAVDAEDAQAELVKREKERVYSQELRQQIAGNARKRAADQATEDARPQNDYWNSDWKSENQDKMVAEDATKREIEREKVERDRIYSEELLQQIADNANRRAAHHAAEVAWAQNNEHK